MQCVAFLALCLVAFAAAQSAQSVCTPVSMRAACSKTFEIKSGEWEKVGIGGGSNVCYLLHFDMNESAAGELFVLAVRPDDQYASQVNVAAYQNTTHYPPIGCVHPSSSMTEDDMSYNCYDTVLLGNQGASGSVLIVGVNNGQSGSTVRIMAGFAQGTSTDCTASFVSYVGGSGNIWWIVMGVSIAMVVLVLIALVGGFFIMRRHSYSLYEYA